MKQTNTKILASLVALGIVLAVGLIVMPALEKAQASSTKSDARNKLQQGIAKSGHSTPHPGLGCSFFDPRC